jgi:hypothetical protein
VCSSLPRIFYSFSVYLLQKSHFHPLDLTMLSLKAYVDCFFLSSAPPISEGPLLFLKFPRIRPLVLLIRLVLSRIRMWPYTEGTWLYCDYFIWVYLVLCFNLFCNVWVCVCVGFVMCRCFGNMHTCIYCVLYCLYYVFWIVSFIYVYSYLFCLY